MLREGIGCVIDCSDELRAFLPSYQVSVTHRYRRFEARNSGLGTPD